MIPFFLRLIAMAIGIPVLWFTIRYALSQFEKKTHHDDENGHKLRPLARVP